MHYIELISGDIINPEEIKQLQKMPLPSDNWYLPEDVFDGSHHQWGAADLQMFALIDDMGQDGPRWFPVSKTEDLFDEAYSDGDATHNTETVEVQPEDFSSCEWTVVFKNFKNSYQEGSEINKWTVDFDCPGCGHEHNNVMFVGWTAVSCLGCGATLTREENSKPLFSGWETQTLRNINTFWSLALHWIAVNRPSLRISGRIGARKYCHKFDVSIEDFCWLHELTEVQVSKYLDSKLP